MADDGGRDDDDDQTSGETAATGADEQDGSHVGSDDDGDETTEQSGGAEGEDDEEETEETEDTEESQESEEESKPAIRFRTSFQNTIFDVMLARGWVETHSDTDWEFQWMDRDGTYEVFDTQHLDSTQRVNHFRNDRELCRKDLLIKNLKKYRRRLLKAGQEDQARECEMWPASYVLPHEYSIFAEEFKRALAEESPAPAWIMKPVGRSQGKGIFLFRKIADISRWRNDGRVKSEREDGPELFIVQRYISNPYLVAGRKFDIRVYALVLSYVPLVVWFYRSGFCRFSASRYSNAVSDMSNQYVHLTNVAIQKRSDQYDSTSGGKWEMRQLKLHFISRYGRERVDRMCQEIELIIIHSLLSVQQTMINDKHCFELYGYDVLIADDLKPWLLEVNASPSLSANTPADYQLKFAMLQSCLDVVDMEGRRHGDETRIGGFDLIYHDGFVRASHPASLYQSMLGAEIPTEPHIVRGHPHEAAVVAAAAATTSAATSDRGGGSGGVRAAATASGASGSASVAGSAIGGGEAAASGGAPSFAGKRASGGGGGGGASAADT